MELNDILMRSAELDERLHRFCVGDDTNTPDKARGAVTLCRMVFEHAESFKILAARGNFTSAIALVRLQYESLVRAFWILYVATDAHTTKLMSNLTEESAKAGSKIPMVSAMLSSLEDKAPKEAVEMLLEIKEYSLPPLNSFVHAGIHAIDRNRNGYPLDLLIQVVKTSNGISTMAAMLLVMLSNNPPHKGKLPAIQREFADCLPSPKDQAGPKGANV